MANRIYTVEGWVPEWYVRVGEITKTLQRMERLLKKHGCPYEMRDVLVSYDYEKGRVYLKYKSRWDGPVKLYPVSDIPGMVHRALDLVNSQEME